MLATNLFMTAACFVLASMFSRKILLALGVAGSASAFAPAGPALRVGASKAPVLKSSAPARRPVAVQCCFFHFVSLFL